MGRVRRWILKRHWRKMMKSGLPKQFVDDLIALTLSRVGPLPRSDSRPRNEVIRVPAGGPSSLKFFLHEKYGGK